MGMRQQAPGKWGLPLNLGQGLVCCNTVRVCNPTLVYLEQDPSWRAPPRAGWGEPGTSRGAVAPWAGTEIEQSL